MKTIDLWILKKANEVFETGEKYLESMIFQKVFQYTHFISVELGGIYLVYQG